MGGGGVELFVLHGIVPFILLIFDNKPFFLKNFHNFSLKYKDISNLIFLLLYVNKICSVSFCC